jgi:hypothetical protein
MTSNSTPTGNDTYLFIGGRGDGERINVPTPNVLYVLRVMPKLRAATAAEERPLPTVPVEDAEEVYQMRKIAISEKKVFYYGHVTLSDEDCIRLLLSHYQP